MLHLWSSIQSNMAVFCLIIALVIQNSLTETVFDYDSSSNEFQEDFNATEVDGSIMVDGGILKDFQPEPINLMDALLGSSGTFYPTYSSVLMEQVTNSEKPPEDKIEEIKEMVNQISTSLQSEMVNLLSDASSCTSNEEPDNNLRKKRSIETPMDSTQLVMRLLRHLKSNNEYQNIAIEKMMNAQQIADKFGISFNPDPDTLSDLAFAANEQAKEMSAILQDAFELKNVTKNVSEINEKTNITESTYDNSNETLKEIIEENENYQDNSTIFGVNFEIPEEKNVTAEHPTDSDFNYFNYSPVETQIVSPIPQHCHTPVSQRPSFYDLVSDNSILDYYCFMEPATTTIIVSNDEPDLEEPELVAEEYEETISSKVIINHDEAPDVSTVNHVTSYTISEKAHFRRPHIDNLPQQMQYYFLLM